MSLYLQIFGKSIIIDMTKILEIELEFQSSMTTNFSFFIHFFLWNAVSDFITFSSFIRLCIKFNIFFTLLKLSFPKIIIILQNVQT